MHDGPRVAKLLQHGEVPKVLPNLVSQVDIEVGTVLLPIDCCHAARSEPPCHHCCGRHDNQSEWEVPRQLQRNKPRAQGNEPEVMRRRDSPGPSRLRPCEVSCYPDGPPASPTNESGGSVPAKVDPPKKLVN